MSYNVTSGSKKFSVELPVNDRDKGPTVEDLANLAVQLAEVPRESQRLIFKGTQVYKLGKCVNQASLPFTIFSFLALPRRACKTQLTYKNKRNKNVKTIQEKENNNL